MKKLLSGTIIILSIFLICEAQKDDPFTNFFGNFHKMVDDLFEDQPQQPNVQTQKKPNLPQDENDRNYSVQIVVVDGDKKRVITNQNLPQKPEPQKVVLQGPHRITGDGRPPKKEKKPEDSGPKTTFFTPSTPGQPQQGQQGQQVNGNNNNTYLHQLLGIQQQPEEKPKAKAQKTVTFKDIIGQEAAVNEVKEIVDFLKHPEEYHALGAEMPKGILLDGPPGTGKTLLARAIAGEANCNFIVSHASQFICKYVGTGASAIRELFDQARANKGPTIVFIDELDAIGNRDRNENQEYRHTINELLNQMDGFHADENIVVMAATNHLKSVDSALLRPGRFDRTVNVPLPTRDGRQETLEYYLKQRKLDELVDVKKNAESFAKRTTGFSGADIKKLSNEAALAARREESKVVTQKHIEEAYDKMLLGLKTNFKRSEEQLKRTAYHEAGHTVIRLLTEMPVAKVSILSRGNALGATFSKEKHEQFSDYNKEELIYKLMSLQGGFAAEKVCMNVVTPGASNDLERVNNLANAMIKEYGMGTGKLAGVTYRGMVSNEMKQLFDAEVLNLIQSSKAKTIQMIEENKKLVALIAENLLEKETLHEDEIYQITGITQPIEA
jgi:cell division protease FtsH